MPLTRKSSRPAAASPRTRLGFPRPRVRFVAADQSTPATAAEVLAGLGATSACQGWDMVCSYHLAELNAMLVANLAAGGMESVTVPFTGSGTNISGNPYTLSGSVL